MRHIKRIGIVLALLFAFLGIPALVYAEQLSALFAPGPDAVSSASIEIPAQPSGEYVVLLNRKKHPNTQRDWEAFFSEQPTDVIFEDIVCLTAEGDPAGKALAERYRARLAEHQMTLKSENGLLAVSKAQWGVFDVLILSREAAEAYRLDTVRREDVLWINVKGGAA